jgi:hypothetical protein
MTIALKARAKRLRPAIADMFGIKVSNSQALELVSKEENFPNWDAACASSGSGSQKTEFDLPEIAIEVTAKLGERPTIAGIFKCFPKISVRLNNLMKTTDAGALILVATRTCQGKTTTAHALFNKMIEGNDDPINVLHVGIQEYVYPRNVFVRYVDESGTCFNDSQMREKIVVVDEIRTNRMAFEVIALVQAGITVVATIQATSGLDRMIIMLRQFGLGESMLRDLIQRGRVIGINQLLKWGDRSMFKEVTQVRNERTLRNAGVAESRIASVIAMGPNAVFDELMSAHTRF